MTREESEKYIKSKMCNNCGIYLGGGKCSDNCNVIEAIQALSQDPCEDTRNMDEIAEIMKSDVNANIKCKMIDNIINSELHYFKLQQPCDAVSREEAIKVLRADTLFVCTGDKMQAISDIEGLSSVTVRQMGEWIEVPRYEGDTQPDLKCPFCGLEIDYYSYRNFCASCGVRMIR